jgi:glutamine amidotransferase
MRVGLIDYRVGNIHSLRKALEQGGATVTVTPSWKDALSNDALVLPGVGSFGAAALALRGNEEWIRSALEEELPCLGICLGMQLLFQGSEEGEGAGIGFIPGTVRRLTTSRVPHMGWNDVEVVPRRGEAQGDGSGDPIFSGAGSMAAYYANSFVCHPREDEDVIAWSECEGQRFPAAVRKQRCWGVQFHPEKSSGPGLQIIHSFLEEAR